MSDSSSASGSRLNTSDATHLRRRRDAGGPSGSRRIADLVAEHARTLAAAGLPTPAVDARALTRFALGLDAAAVVTAPIEDVEPTDLGRLAELVDRRAAREPLQHLTGHSAFRELSLECRAGVFVPRPETEILAGLAVDAAAAAVRGRGQALVIEPCTGTGAVALSIVAEVAGADVVATDISAAAVDLARDNLERVRRAGVAVSADRCRFLRGDLFGPVPRELRGHADVVVANPPYLTEQEVQAAGPEVRDHDPPEALVAAEQGFAVIERLLADSGRWLRPDGWVLVEIAEARPAESAARARSHGYRDVDVVADLAGRPRVLRARPAGEGAS